ncbi:hypothetical protein EV127DRAFT_511515 [Xylaria flabelliformis]|nr:hypothetical protein EV127DRAFT_511515 [Xylaria flabelliformis]
MPRFVKPPSAGEDIVWDKDILLGPGGPHDREMLARLKFKANREVAGKGTVDYPKVIWLSEPPEYDLEKLEELLMTETRRCGQAFVWVMMGTHNRTTVSITRGTFGKTRKMSDDDDHITVRMGPDKDTCKLHGHLYVVVEEKEIIVKGASQTVEEVKRLMTPNERNYVGGQPRHLWIWGPYSRECPSWPRSKTKLPETPFTRKPGR